MAIVESRSQDPASHVRILGVLWLIYGIMRLIEALWLLSFSGKATIMFGTLLTRVADPFSLMNAFHLIYTGMVVLSFACGVVGILAGLALLAGQRAGRYLALAAAFLSVSNLPLGTTLGVYTLIVLLP